MTSVTIDGTKLRTLLTEKGIRQNFLSKKIGVTKYNVNRWCRHGVKSSVRVSNLEQVALVIGISLRQLLDACAVDDYLLKISLSTAELDFLEAFRKLSPLQQAKARVDIEAILEKGR